MRMFQLQTWQLNQLVSNNARFGPRLLWEYIILSYWKSTIFGHLSGPIIKGYLHKTIIYVSDLLPAHQGLRN